MGQISTEEDIAERTKNAAVMEGRVSDDLAEKPPVHTDLFVRRSSTATCTVVRSQPAERVEPTKVSRNPNVRARPLDYSDPADRQRRATAIATKLHRDLKAMEKRKRMIVVPD